MPILTEAEAPRERKQWSRWLVMPLALLPLLAPVGLLGVACVQPLSLDAGRITSESSG